MQVLPANRQELFTQQNTISADSNYTVFISWPKVVSFYDLSELAVDLIVIPEPTLVNLVVCRCFWVYCNPGTHMGAHVSVTTARTDIVRHFHVLLGFSLLSQRLLVYVVIDLELGW